jgi:hypothetical protein
MYDKNTNSKTSDHGRSLFYFSLWNSINKISAILIIIVYFLVYFYVSYRGYSFIVIFVLIFQKMSFTFLFKIFAYLVILFVFLRMFLIIQFPLIVVFQKYFWKNAAIKDEEVKFL